MSPPETFIINVLHWPCNYVQFFVVLLDINCSHFQQKRIEKARHQNDPAGLSDNKKSKVSHRHELVHVSLTWAENIDVMILIH